MPQVSVIGPDELDFQRHADLMKRAFAPVLAGTGEEETLTPAFFRWKYNGPVAPPRIALVRDGERILAANSMYAVDIVWKGRRVRGWVSSDTATDPDARGPGYFLACLKALNKQLGPDEIFFGFPNKNSIKGFQSVGWTEQQVMPAWMRVVPRGRVPGFEAIDSLGSDFDALFSEYVQGRPPMIERTAAYMNWRYFKHPVAKYAAFALRKSGRLQGVIVLRKVKSLGWNMALVMDFIALDAKTEAQLLRFAAGWAREQGLWPAVAFSSAVTPFLGLRTGYLLVPSRFLPKRQALLGRGTGKESSEIFGRPWQLQLGDWDGF
jgi:hypothetical protein